MKNTPLVLCVIILGISALQSADPPQPEPVTFVASLKLTKDERTVLERYIGHAVRYADSLSAQKVASRCLASPEMFAWEEFLYLGALLDAYQLTEDTKYLDKFKQAFALFTDVLRTGDDGYLGWYGKPIPPRRVPGRPDLQIDELQMNFRAIAILSRWVELTRSDAEYARANEGSISGYLELMEKQLFPKWDERGFFVDMGSQGAVCRGLDYPLCDSQEPGVTLSHEKRAIVVDGLLALYRATGSPQYMRRAVQLGTRFKRSLSLKDGRYEWMSWEPAGSWDVDKSKPDGWRVEWIAPDPLGERYVATVSIAVNLYQYGLVFDEEDIARLIATQKTRCWNGDFASPVPHCRWDRQRTEQVYQRTISFLLPGPLRLGPESSRFRGTSSEGNPGTVGQLMEGRCGDFSLHPCPVSDASSCGKWQAALYGIWGRVFGRRR